MYLFTQTPESKEPSLLLLDNSMCERFVKVDRFQISLKLAVFTTKWVVITVMINKWLGMFNNSCKIYTV